MIYKDLQILDLLKRNLFGTIFYDKTYFVGGFLRDLYLRRISNLMTCDIDLVVELVDGGKRLVEYLDSKNLLGVYAYYEKYGTATFYLKGHPYIKFEVCQTRREKYRSRNSRNPEISYGTLKEDRLRRDFTINSFYLKVSTFNSFNYKHTQINFCKDLKKENNISNFPEVIETVSDPDITFDEDPLRILRGIRFSVTLNLEIEEKTWEGMKNNSGRLLILSQERITSEFQKILQSQFPKKGLELLLKSGCLKYILPELYQSQFITQNKYHPETVLDHTFQVVERCNTVKDIRLAWAALLHDIGKLETRTVDENGNIYYIGHEVKSSEMCDKILTRMKVSKDIIKEVKMLVARHMDFKSYSPDLHELKSEKLRQIQYELGLDLYYLLVTLIEADNMSQSPEYRIEGQGTALKLRQENMFSYKLPITGEDIMKVKNIGPGILVKRYLDYALKLAFVNPKITKEQLLENIKEYNL